MRHYCGVNSRSFSDPIFATSEYVQFEAAVTAAIGAARNEDPHLVAVQKALPAVCDSLRTVTGVVKTGLESNDSSMRCMSPSMLHMERRIECGDQFLQRRLHLIPDPIINL